MLKRYVYIIIVILFSFSCTQRDTSAKVKKCTLAGKWYPSDPEELSHLIDTLFNKTSSKSKYINPLLLILPHAGYHYSGKTAAAGYKIIKESLSSQTEPDLIIILAPSHYKAFKGCAVSLYDYFETPAGKVKINRAIAKKLISEGLRDFPEAFEQEHSIEIHLPFIQKIFGNKLENDIQVLPVLTGDLNNESVKETAGKIISSISGSRPLFIISSDFTHYGPAFAYKPFKNDQNKIRDLDSGAIDFILKRDLPGFSEYIDKTGATICGRNAIKLALALPIKDFKSYNISYTTSGEITGDFSNTVSYSSILFCGSIENNVISKKEALTHFEKRFLLKAARKNILSWITKNQEVQIPPENIPESCKEKYGAFITLKKNNNLRGCIGYIQGHKPLYKTVLENSYNAAFRDPRFPALEPAEIRDIVIEISVLTKPEQIKSVNEIKTGRDGLIVDNGIRRGLLLPQVATEYEWDAESFLSHTCLKAGLSADAWKDDNIRIYKFEAIVFSELD